MRKRNLPLIAACFILFVSPLGAQPEIGDVRRNIVETAKTYLGVPYVYGAESPKAFDCSGFVRYVYNQAASIVLPRTSRSQWAAGIPTTLTKAKPGDILVFDTVGGAPSHVAIFIDEKSFINAVSDGPKTGVVISRLGSYWSPLLLGARVYVVAGAESAIPMKRAGEPSKPAPDPGKRVPGPAAPLPRDELPVSFVGFTITGKPERTTDKIPAQVGTAIQYAVTNGTGADGVFEILFYRMDLDPAKHETLRRDRVAIPAGGMRLVEPFTFTRPGQYRLILKTHDNLQRVERIWKVVEIN